MTTKQIGNFYYILAETATLGKNDENEKGNAVASQDYLNNSKLVIPPTVIDPSDNKEYNITAIGISAFHGCEINEVVFSNNLKIISAHAFEQCELSSNISFPDSLESIGNWAFSSNAFPSFNVPKKLKIIGAGAFAHNRRLTDINVDKENKCFRCDSQGILYDYYYKTLILCPKRDSVKIPSTVRKVLRISFVSSTFSTIIFPPSVKYVESSIFVECKNLNTVIFQGNVKFLDGQMISKTLTNFTYHGTREVPNDIFGSYIPNSIYVCSGYRGEKFANQSFTLNEECPAYPIPITCHAYKRSLNTALSLIISVLLVTEHIE